MKLVAEPNEDWIDIYPGNNNRFTTQIIGILSFDTYLTCNYLIKPYSEKIITLEFDLLSIYQEFDHNSLEEFLEKNRKRMIEQKTPPEFLEFNPNIYLFSELNNNNVKQDKGLGFFHVGSNSNHPPYLILFYNYIRFKITTKGYYDVPDAFNAIYYPGQFSSVITYTNLGNPQLYV